MPKLARLKAFASDLGIFAYLRGFLSIRLKDRPANKFAGYRYKARLRGLTTTRRDASRRRATLLLVAREFIRRAEPVPGFQTVSEEVTLRIITGTTASWRIELKIGVKDEILHFVRNDMGWGWWV